jgi:16S rRNA (guanine527-N7)-methyltransferase
MPHPLWIDLAARANRSLSDGQQQQLATYLDLLLAANQRMNLTRIVDRESAEVQHVGDALTLLKYLPEKTARVADVGSGGGVPGMPLAIALPGVKFVLFESTKKKAAFLEQTVRDLGLDNVRVSDLRAEDAGRDAQFRETFDVAIARAVGAMNWLAEWCLPLVRKGGIVLAMKGPKAAEELPLAEHAIKILGGGSPDVHPADLPGASQHVIVEIRKTTKTPHIYPRAATATKGKPL